MRLSAFVLFSLLVGSSVLAAPSSEFYHQAGGGVLEITAGLQTEYAISKFANNAKSEGFDGILSLQIERGFGERWATGLWAGFGYAEVTRFGTDEDSAGLEDIQIYMKGFYPTAEGSFRYGLSFSVSLEDKEIDSDGFRNRASGGTGARLYLGYEHNDGPYRLGFRVSQELGLEDRLEKSEVGGEIEVTGSKDFEVAFYLEKTRKDSGYWGGKFSYTLVSDRVANGAETENISPLLRVQAYRPTPMGASMLIPKLSLGMATADTINSAELDEYTEVRLALDYRF